MYEILQWVRNLHFSSAHTQLSSCIPLYMHFFTYSFFYFWSSKNRLPNVLPAKGFDSNISTKWKKNLEPGFIQRSHLCSGHLFNLMNFSHLRIQTLHFTKLVIQKIIALILVINQESFMEIQISRKMCRILTSTVFPLFSQTSWATLDCYPEVPIDKSLY